MAIGFDGVDDRINPSTFGASIPGDPLTMAAHYTVNNLTTELSLVGCAAADGDYHVLNFSGNVANDPVNARSLNSGINSSNAYSGASGVGTGQWNHALARYNTTGSRIGVTNGNGGTTDPTVVSCSAMTSVSAGAFTTFHSGSIAGACLYSDALLDPEIGSLRWYPARRVRPQKLMAYFDLVRNTRQRMSACGQPSSIVGTFVTTHPRMYGF